MTLLFYLMKDNRRLVESYLKMSKVQINVLFHVLRILSKTKTTQHTAQNI